MNIPFKLLLFSFLALCGTAFLTSAHAQETEPWISFKSPSFNYTIDFPSVPSEVTDTIETDAGLMLLNVAELDCSAQDNNNNLMYMINCTVYPESLIHSKLSDITDNFFASTINGAVSNISGKLLSLSEIEYAGYPGRQVEISADEGLSFFTSRLYLIENRFFMIIILTDSEKGNNPDINRFFNSFRTY